MACGLQPQGPGLPGKLWPVQDTGTLACTFLVRSVNRSLRKVHPLPGVLLELRHMEPTCRTSIQASETLCQQGQATGCQGIRELPRDKGHPLNEGE